jgi:hypothetical protein
MGWSDEAAEASYRRRGQMTIDRAAIFEQFYGEMKKARERILTTADGEVGWLLKFIQTDLEALTPSEWMVLAFEVASFVDDVANRHGEEIATEGGLERPIYPRREVSWHYSKPRRGQRDSDHGPPQPGKLMEKGRGCLHVSPIHDHCHVAGRGP